MPNQEQDDVWKTAEGFNDRAIDMAEKGDLESAIMLLKHIIDFAPGYGLAYYNRGVVKVVQHDYDGATSDFACATALDSNLESQHVLPLDGYDFGFVSPRYRRSTRNSQRGHSYREELIRLLYKQSFQCGICGADMSSYNASDVDVDHIKPRSKGGSDDPSNLQATCAICNQRKGAEEISNHNLPLI